MKLDAIKSRFKKTLKKIIPVKLHAPTKFIYGFIAQFIYFGFRFKCPICKGNFRKFLKYGLIPRPNARCPRCRSLERHRLLWLFLKNKTNFFYDNLKVLEIAPHFYLQKRFKNLENITYISADISSPVAMVKMDITNISLPDNQFDCIICYHVLEHILDDEKAMKELFRILKPDGWAILQSPVDHNREKTFEDLNIVSPSDRERVFWQKDHVRIYGRDYKDRLKGAGFIVKLDNFVKELKSEDIKRYGLSKNEIIYFCTKPRP
jgi:predicted SAM-dependent methyltransferase